MFFAATNRAGLWGAPIAITKGTFDSEGILGCCSGSDDSLVCLLGCDVLDADPAELDCEGALVTRAGKGGDGVLSTAPLAMGDNVA
jgi:hypothetical protein